MELASPTQTQPGLQRIPILASGHQLFLLRRFGFRFHFPHVFPGEILPNARRRHVSRQIRGFFLDAPLRGVAVNDDCPVRKRAISGLQFNVHDGVRLGTEKRKREHVLSRIVFVHGAVLALGVVGVSYFFGIEPGGGFVRMRGWTFVFLFVERVSRDDWEKSGKDTKGGEVFVSGKRR